MFHNMYIYMTVFIIQFHLIKGINEYITHPIPIELCYITLNNYEHNCILVSQMGN